MKVIKFFVIGEPGIGKSTLIDTYLWKLHFGYAYHDHLMDIRRYHIQLEEISQFEEYENVCNQRGYDVPIFLLCFKVTERKSLRAVRDKWLPLIRKSHGSVKIFLLALQCDLRNRFREKIKQTFFKTNEGVRMCRFIENLYYLECSNRKVKSVKNAFDNALHAVLYDEKEAEIRIVKLYNLIRIKFSFNENGSAER